jgi:flagellar biosynthesis/type III secretory pathway protein FliH
MTNTIKITDNPKVKTSALMQQMRDRFKVWSWYSDEELDKQFPPPKKATTRYFNDTVEGDEDLRNISANDIKEKNIPTCTLRERLLMEETHKELIQEAESSGYQRGLHESCIKVDKEMLAFLRDHNESGDFLKKLNAETYQKGYEEGMKQQSDWDVEGLGLAEIRDRVVEKALASYKEELVKIIEQVEYPLAAMMEDLVVYNHRKEGGKTMKNRILRKFSSIIDIIKK